LSGTGNSTSANLDTHGVVMVNGQPFVFIDCDHPVISLLRNNAHLIGCDVDSQNFPQKRMGDRYFQISKHVLQNCCDTQLRPPKLWAYISRACTRVLDSICASA
jgi:hypothetical protein